MSQATSILPTPSAWVRSVSSVSILITGLLLMAGCATSNPPASAVSTLCAPEASLKDYSQRSLLGVGYEAIQKSNFVCAERLLSEAHKLDPKDPWALLNLGVARHRSGQLDGARLAYQMAAAVDPKTSGVASLVKTASDQKQEVAEATIRQVRANYSAGEIALENLKLIR